LKSSSSHPKNCGRYQQSLVIVIDDIVVINWVQSSDTTLLRFSSISFTSFLRLPPLFSPRDSALPLSAVSTVSAVFREREEFYPADPGAADAAAKA
jgi:hypothetical protein